MRKLIIIVLLALPFIACTESNNGLKSSSQALTKVYDSEAEAIANSPSGQACLVSGELREECVPSNRGKNGNCEMRTIDTRKYSVAFYRGDVDYNGTIADRDDAQLATKNLYVKQLDNEPCPAAADITSFEGVDGRGDYVADGYFTSNDINLWREIKRTGNYPKAGEVICANQCEIVNHMSPEYKK